MIWSFDANKSNALELRPFVGDCFTSISAKIWCPIDPLPLDSDGLAALPLPRVSHFFKSKIHYSCNYGTWPSWSISFLFSYIVAAIATGTYKRGTDKTTMVRSDMTSSSQKWMTFKWNFWTRQYQQFRLLILIETCYTKHELIMIKMY